MTTTPPEAPDRPDEQPTDGPRVSAAEVRDLGRLRRSVTDRKIAGVAGGIARHLDIDPLVVRVVLVVLVFFGLAGALLYAACWLFVPEEGTERAPIRLDERSRSVALVVVLALAGLAVIGDSWAGVGFPWPLALAAVVVLAVLTYRGQSSAPPAPPASTAAARTAFAPGQAPVRPVNPRRRGPALFGFALALIGLALALLATADLAGAPVAGSTYPALALAITGVMLLVGAFYGRAGGLILVGLVAAAATLASTVADEYDGGRIDAMPTTAADVRDSYRLDAGEIVVDLSQVRDVAALDGREIDVDADFGRIEVVVPAEVEVRAQATVHGAGHTQLFGVDRDGFEASNTESRGVAVTSDGGGTGGTGTDPPQITIDAGLDFGEIVVRTEEIPR